MYLLIFVFFFSKDLHSIEFLTIESDPSISLEINQALRIIPTIKKGKKLNKISLPPKRDVFPIQIIAQDPIGLKKTYLFGSFDSLKDFEIKSSVIQNKNPRPKRILFFPKLCSRLQWSQDKKSPVIYDASLDALNHVPSAQILDPDITKGQQYKTFSEMDGKNVLLLKEVVVKNDYEDDRILDYEGPHPLTGKKQKIYEGQGGFYANFHYAIVPFDKRYSKLNRQDLLHLAQGKLDEINRDDLRPALRVHSFIPGPYFSGMESAYELCEWGDTSYQVPEQKLHYNQMALWDWDFSVPGSDHILIIVWEGDEEDWLIRDQLIHPFVLTDDIVALFELRRKQTEKEIRLVNKKRDFEMRLINGDI